MDKTDWKILKELQQNARLPYAEIGRRVGLTAPAVAERINKMETAGIIKGFSILLDLEKLNRPITSYIRVGAMEHNPEVFEKFVTTLPDVVECAKVTGNDGYIMKVAVKTMTDLQQLVGTISRYAPTTTAISLGMLVESHEFDLDNE